MIDIRKSILIAISLYSSSAFITSANNQSTRLNTADLVRTVRESENWIHKIDSFYVRIESKWTRTLEGIAARHTELEKQYPNTKFDPNQWTGLKPTSTGTIAFAFDQKRLWDFKYFPDESRLTRIWDGEKSVAHEEFFFTGRDSYFIDGKLENFNGPMFIHISWLRSQPHSFWWKPTDVNERMKFYGYPEDFVLTGRQNYRGIKCYVLDFKPAKGLFAASELSKRWYVGVEDRRLYGFSTLLSGQVDTQHWTTDYKEVVKGCWFPMTQGYELYELESEDKPYLRAFQEQRFVEVRIDQELPDDLFGIKFKEGLEIHDRRSGQLITYIYKAPLAGKAFPSLEGININFDLKQVSEHSILFCFFDYQQRPSRNCILQLSTRAQELQAKDIVIVAIHASKIEQAKLDEWIKENNIEFPIGTIQGNEEKMRFNWGVKSLPWLILADKEHIVTAEGFGLDELDEKISINLKNSWTDIVVALWV